ncbi:hypothetical protein [Acanthopleuribacter pedis]|uniref:Uncharacterized protein n=1 Tax=Acanthopleuribacter pedis TaxID=442870 RepID=A0A8J7QEV1_9BACT|nr:hypothetical protein [Acanthopleuribacter pedis]MBO1322989.1 hypothetical protein [Acanthopleuribacter pedis]
MAGHNHSLPPHLTWQYVFGSILADYLAVHGFLTQIDYLYSPRAQSLRPLDAAEPEDDQAADDLALGLPLLDGNPAAQSLTSFLMKPRSLRAVFSVCQTPQRWDRRPDGFEHLGRHNLFMFEPELKGDLLHELTANGNDYLKGRDLWEQPARSVSMGLFAVAAKADQALLPEGSFQALLPGVWRLEVGPRALTIIVIDYLANIPENDLWHLFSFDAARIHQAWHQLIERELLSTEHRRMLEERYHHSGIAVSLG